MKDSKVVYLLKTLDAKEFRWFERYVNSKFNNANDELIHLFNAIKRHYPAFNSTKLNRKKIFTKIFQTQKYDDQKMRQLQSGLAILAEKYITQIEFESEDIVRNNYLLKALQKRKLDKYFMEHLKKTENFIQEEKIKDSDFLFNQYSIAKSKHSFLAMRKDRALDSSLQQMTDNLDVFYLSAKLKYCCAILNSQNIASANYKISLMNELVVHVENANYENTPSILIYYRIIKTLLDEEDEEQYMQLLFLLEKHQALISKSELQDMYALAQNYCIKKINKGKVEYLRKIFELYKTLLATGILIQEAILSQWDYKNIIVTALRLNEFKWAEKFIVNYKEKLLPKDKENAYTYNLAYLHFYKKEYRKALKLLQGVEFTDIFYQLDSKALLLKIYYEAGDLEPLLSMIDSFKTFLRRNKMISDYQNQAYLNLVKSVQKLSEIKFEQKGSAKKFQEEIKNITPMADISWLNKSLDELMS